MCSDIFSPAIRTTAGWMALLMAAAAAGSGCGDVPTSATPATPESPPPSSRPRPASAAIISSAVGAGGAYVSMKPGTQANGQRADIRNLRTGAVAAAPMTDGGFDPVGIAAQVGDTLSVTVVLRSGAQTIGYGVVPMRLQPMVVRTWPAGGKSDVPLNSIIRVVFNQPMDGVSLPKALHLLLDGVAVPGTVSVDSTGGVILSGRFLPAVPLAPLSVYEVLVSPDARSLNGDTLAPPASAQFTTQSQAPPDTPPPAGSIQVHVHTTGAPLDPDGYTIVVDNLSSGQTAPVNGEVLLTNLAPGNHVVRLEGAADNCWFSKTTGAGQFVSVPSGNTASVTFDPVCVEPGTGAIYVQVKRTGDPFSYFTALILSRSDGLTRTIQPGVFHGLTKGSYQVLLTGGVPFHLQCGVGAPNPRTVAVESDSVTTTVFQLRCSNE
jgi:Bacterial Ig-like domain